MLRYRCVHTVVLLTVSVAVSTVWSEDWTGFRGPERQGISEARDLPTTWDSRKNVLWKTELPGPGGSTPITLGERIYVTCYSGYAEDAEEPGDIENLTRHLICLDRSSGKLLWDKTFKAKMPESEYTGGANNKWHGYATSTPVTDGEKIYIFFGISGVYAFDLDGKELWKTDVGDQTHGWGCATSPLLYKDLLIVNASIESNSLVALDKATGKEVWKVDGITKSWSSPTLVDVGGKQEMVLNFPNPDKSKTSRLKGLDPSTGEVLWHCEGLPDSYLCPTPVSHDGVVYAIGARKNTAMAVKAGGRGDVTESHVLWSEDEGANVTSPVYIDGYLYYVHERGKATCLNAKTGEVVFKESLDPSPKLTFASVIAADGKLYVPSHHDGTYVLAAKPEFKQLAVNQFDDDDSRVNASFAVADGQLIMRSDQAIYCIANTAD